MQGADSTTTKVVTGAWFFLQEPQRLQAEAGQKGRGGALPDWALPRPRNADNVVMICPPSTTEQRSSQNKEERGNCGAISTLLPWHTLWRCCVSARVHKEGASPSGGAKSG